MKKLTATTAANKPATLQTGVCLLCITHFSIKVGTSASRFPSSRENRVAPAEVCIMIDCYFHSLVGISFCLALIHIVYNGCQQVDPHRYGGGGPSVSLVLSYVNLRQCRCLDQFGVLLYSLVLDNVQQSRYKYCCCSITYLHFVYESLLESDNESRFMQATLGSPRTRTRNLFNPIKMSLSSS